MAMNKYMHPRNIYKTPPNFKQLAIDYPEFRKYVSQDLTGKVTIDFKDVNALRALSCTLLKKDFNLNVVIPPSKLIPTIPLRLNYILWIEDLLSITKTMQDAKGIDIGTGAACVYPLLAAKKYNWFMLATEINDDSIKSARENVERNDLTLLIEVKKVDSKSLLLEAVEGKSEAFDFCMCNPPFFSSSQELHPMFKSRNINRPRPRNAFCANVKEVVSEGGEVEFITRMINESKKLGEKIRIYTTMVGHKSSMSPLKKILREVDVISFKETEFCQGHTTRWGLAWTFCEIDLRKIPEETVAAAKKEKDKTPLHYDLPDANTLSVEKISQNIVEIFNKLLITYEEIKHSKNVVGYRITAYSNTWSHQRRKKRAQKRLQSILSNNGSESVSEEKDIESGLLNGMTSLNDKIENAVNLFAELEVEGNIKRPLEEYEETEYFRSKKLKSDELSPDKKCYLKAIVSLRHENGKFNIEMSWLDGTAGREGLHQVMQYFKNNLKLEEPTN